jgi:hypothetical protein
MPGPVTPSRTPDGFLTHQRVVDVYGRCMRSEGFSPNKKGVVVESWMMRHTFSIKALMDYREEIVRMLLCLPAGFRVDVSGGGSVMMGDRRDDGTYWTNDIAVLERLLALGLGVNLITFCAPREKWHELPGKVPYFRIDITRFGVRMN